MNTELIIQEFELEKEVRTNCLHQIKTRHSAAAKERQAIFRHISSVLGVSALCLVLPVIGMLVDPSCITVEIMSAPISILYALEKL